MQCRLSHISDDLSSSIPQNIMVSPAWFGWKVNPIWYNSAGHNCCLKALFDNYPLSLCICCQTAKLNIAVKLLLDSLRWNCENYRELSHARTWFSQGEVIKPSWFRYFPSFDRIIINIAWFMIIKTFRRHQSANHRSAMMTSSNGNIFGVTGPLYEEFTGQRWIPRTWALKFSLIWA